MKVLDTTLCSPNKPVTYRCDTELVVPKPRAMTSRSCSASPSAERLPDPFNVDHARHPLLPRTLSAPNLRTLGDNDKAAREIQSIFGVPGLGPCFENEYVDGDEPPRFACDPIEERTQKLACSPPIRDFANVVSRMDILGCNLRPSFHPLA